MIVIYSFLLGFTIGKFNRLWISEKPTWFVIGAGYGLGIGVALPFVIFQIVRP